MAISAINSYSVTNPNFTSKNQKVYENPVNRKTERNLSILGCVGTSALVGGTGYLLTTCFKSGWKVPSIVGGIAAAATLLLTLPSRLYNTKQVAFAKEKEMDVFSRQKEAQAKIYEGINDEIQDEDVSLEEKINHYATVKMADNGKGLMVKGA